MQYPATMMLRLILCGLFCAATVHAESLFPVSYEESRARFRDGCVDSRALGAGFCRGYGIPSRIYGDLSVDVAYFSRGGSRLLILESGTHGAEGYAGAAIQELARRAHLERLLDRGIDVLMIHALNPFGYHAGRRSDENNVNLNRNFLGPGETFAATNDGYRRMRSTFEPGGEVSGATWAYLGVDLGLLGRLAQALFSVRTVTSAMMAGQYEFPRGIEYGGTESTPQVGILRDLLTPLLNSHRKTVFVDWHTGLGRRGVLHLMVGKTSHPELVAELKSPLASLADEGVETTIVATAKGFYSTTGGVEAFVPTLAGDEARVVGITAEFGTMGIEIPRQIESAHRIIVENQAWFHGCADPLVQARVRHDFVSMFNPPEREWQASTLRQADRFLNAIERSFK